MHGASYYPPAEMVVADPMYSHEAYGTEEFWQARERGREKPPRISPWCNIKKCQDVECGIQHIKGDCQNDENGMRSRSWRGRSQSLRRHSGHRGTGQGDAQTQHHRGYEIQPQIQIQTVCPTPYVLGPVCERGERDFPRWRCAPNSAELLGTHVNMMSSTAHYLFDVAASCWDTHRGMRLLSAADGCSDDTQLDQQARYVPTSVMLAHAFAISNGVWHDERTRVRLYGGDVRNPISYWWQQQFLPWQMPRWLEHRFLALDNTRDLGPQLYNNHQCQEGQLFDAVFMRQGLCFCDDPSKTSTAWPREVSISRAQTSDVCGVYILEPYLFEGRPEYRRGTCVLRWCPAHWSWAVLDAAGGTWAYARGDVGHPALARGQWAVWDGVAHNTDRSFTCDLFPPGGSPPWHRPPEQRACCAGVTGDYVSILRLLQRVVAILDDRQPHSFGLLHGAWTNGTQAEVEQVHRHIVEATRLFNEQRSGVHAATVLHRTTAAEYWLQCDGIVLFQPGSRADPFCVHPAPCYYDRKV
mmetsp:Transcript_119257/g.338140  ORF Transcript_119257/g.338140 Transcript_119257/m.338140 type:complete len:525 (+) Transcript_119257:35-1609(+)